MNFKQLGISNDLVNTLNQMGIKNRQNGSQT